jgi:hypothetical protein
VTMGLWLHYQAHPAMYAGGLRRRIARGRTVLSSQHASKSSDLTLLASRT